MRKKYGLIGLVLLLCFSFSCIVSAGEIEWTDTEVVTEEVIANEAVEFSDIFSDGMSGTETDEISSIEISNEDVSKDEIVDIEIDKIEMSDDVEGEVSEDIIFADDTLVETAVEEPSEDIILGIEGEASLVNNSFSNATYIGTNMSYVDNLVSYSDVNYYKFTLNNNGYVSISFKHGYVASGSRYWKVYLYDQNSKELICRSFKGNTTSEEFMSKIGLSAGTYYVKIVSDNYSNVTYNFKVNYTSTFDWEKEFNDTPDTANSISVNTEVKGSLREYEDKDYYKFTINSAGYASLSFKHEYVDSGSKYWEVYLYDQNNKELVYRSFKGNTTSEEFMPKIGLPAGTYYAKIVSYHHSDVTYNIKVNYTSASDWEKEFNDTFDTANSISVNTEVKGSLREYEDNDYYKFAISSAGYVSLSFKHEYVDSSSKYWEVYLYDQNSKELVCRSFKGNTTSEEFMPKIGLSAGTYYAKVVSYHHSDAAYTFKVNYTSASDWEKEFNDTFDTANSISVNTGVKGSLREYEDEDYYKFTIGNAGYVSISFKHEYVDSSSNYWEVYLYDQNSKELIYRSFKGNTTSEEFMPEIGLQAGTYYVKIESWNHSDVTYNIKVNYTSSSSWEKEFNDTFDTANSISIDKTVKGSLRESEDEDYYKFRISSAGYVNLSFKHEYVDSSSDYWKIYLYNADSKEMISYRFAGNTKSEKSTPKIGLPKGTYYVKVQAYNYSDVRYSLKVKYKKTSEWESEINNLYNRADTITVGKAVNGNLFTYEDTDYYKLKVSVAGYYRPVFSHKAISNSSRYWCLDVYNSEMVSQGSYYFVGNKASENGNWLSLSKGTYYFRVSSSSYYSSNDYTLKIEPYMAKPSISSVKNKSKGIAISWTKTSGAAGYYVYRKENSGSWKKVKTTSSTSWTDTGAKTNGNKYQYKIYGYNGDTKSTVSETKTIYYLTKQTITSLKNTSGRKLTVAWKKNSKATGYQVKYETGSKSETVTISSYKTLSKVLTNLTKKATYKVYVRSYKTVSGKKYYSSWSDSKSIKISK